MKSPIRLAGYTLAIVAVALCCAAWTGCSSITSKNASTDVFAAQQQYKHALYIGDQYGKLPICGSTESGGDTVYCAKAEIVVKIAEAKDVAGPTIKKAQDTVRNPSWDESQRARINLIAVNALQLLTVITDPLEDLIGRAVKAGKAQPEPTTPTAMEMRATPQPLPAPSLGALDVLSVIALFNFILSKLPAGTAFVGMIQADRDTLKAISDEGRQPTDEEWNALNVATLDLEASIDANEARAKAYLAGEGKTGQG